MHLVSEAIFAVFVLLMLIYLVVPNNRFYLKATVTEWDYLELAFSTSQLAFTQLYAYFDA